MDCQDNWVDMIPMMMGSHRHTVHSTTNIEPSAILLGHKPTLSTDMLLRGDEYFNLKLQDEEIEEIDNRNYAEILTQLNFVQESMFDTTSQNISTAQLQQKKYYDIRHSRNFKFAKNDTVIKFLPRNSQRKGGKLDDKFTGPYIIDKITDLGIARLHTPKGKILKKGVPIKQLQKYNKPDDDDNYSNTSNEIEKEEQPKKRRRIFIDSESSNSDVDVMTVSPSPHVNHKRSIIDRKTEEKQEAGPSVKQPVTFTKNNEVGPSVKQPVTFTKNNEAGPSVKLPVTFMKNNEVRPSVKQHVTPKTPNIQDSFRST